MRSNLPRLLGVCSLVSVAALSCDNVDVDSGKSSTPATGGSSTDESGMGESGTAAGGGSVGDQCIEDSLGGAGLCLDAGMWALEAWQDCKDQGFYLADFAPYGECGPGLFERVSVTCCGGSGVPNDPDVPTDPNRPPDGGGTPGYPGYPDQPGYPSNPCALVKCGGDAPVCVVRADGSPACVQGPTGGACSVQKVGFDGQCYDRGIIGKLAFDACASVGLPMGGITTVAECGDGRVMGAEVQCCGPSTDPYPGTDPNPPYPGDPGYPIPDPSQPCVWDAVSYDTCVDPGMLKELAYQACAAQNLMLTELYPANDCGDGTSSIAKYACCGAQAPVPDPTYPTDPTYPPGGVCSSQTLAYGKCIDPGYFKQLASQTCAQSGLALMELSLANDCADGTSSVATFTCCGNGVPTPVDPPPSQCFEDVVSMNSKQCADEGSLAALAKGYCGDAGYTLTDFSPAYDCSNGGSTFAKLRCCASPVPVPGDPGPDQPPPTEPPPPAPAACTYQALGEGNTACRDAAEWKLEAYNSCLAQGLTLTDIGYANDCADGSSRYVKFACCETP